MARRAPQGVLQGCTVTAVENRMGDIHVWLGRPRIEQVGKYNYHGIQRGKPRESDLYLQFQAEKEDFLNSLTPTQRRALQAGSEVTARNCDWAEVCKDTIRGRRR